MGVIFAILGGILKWILLILLGLLGLFILLLLIVVLTPVRYKVQWEKSAETMGGHAKVSWLLHLITFRLEQNGKNIRWTVKIGPKVIAASYPLPQKKQRRRPAKTKPTEEAPERPMQEPPQAEKAESIMPEEISSGAETVPPAEPTAADEGLPIEEKPEAVPAAPEEKEAPEEAETPLPEDRPQKKKTWRARVTEICWKIRRFFEKLIHPFRALREKLRRLRRSLQDLREKWQRVKAIWDGYPQKGETVRAIMDLVTGLLKVPLPKRYEVQVRFGMKDPATTGQILGYYYALGPLLMPSVKRERRLEVEADFENPVLEVKAKCKGHFSIGSFLRPVIRALMNGHIRRLIRYVRSILKKSNG